MNFLESKTICPLPWVNISSDTDGSVRLCCISNQYVMKDSTTKYNLGYDTINDIINSNYLKSVRTDMLNGIPVKGCNKCYQAEKNNSKSYRQENINLYKNNTTFIKKIEQSIKGDIQPTVEYFDLRYGNLCNLSCRSCYPGASSQFNKDVIELKENTDIHKFHNINLTDFNSWYETEIFENNIQSQLSNITDYYCTGGEPTLIEKNFEILNKMIITGNSVNCTLKINTNLTNTKRDFYSLFKSFKKVILMMSIDGYGDMQEYLRYPSRWSVITNNIEKLLSMDLSNLKLIITPVIQKTNLGYITELFEYIENINKKYNKCVILIYPIILSDPSYLNFNYLPLTYKLSCYEKIDSWVQRNCVYQDDTFKSRIGLVKSLCIQEVDYVDSIKSYFEFTDIFDQKRAQNISILNPELSMLRIA